LGAFASQSELGDRYYDDAATKTDGNIFCKSQLSDSGEAKPVWRFAIEKCAL
jgi:hypothetical protein